MKLETFRAPTTEVFIEGHGVTVSATPWANGEGCTALMHGRGDGGLTIRATVAGRWEELDVLLMALTAARSAP